jgi:hypothetical protein
MQASHRILTVVLLAIGVTAAHAGDNDAPKKKGDPKKLSPGMLELIEGTPENFIKHFDRNRDGFLTKEELPPRLAAAFDKADTNGDGQLDKAEVGEMLHRLRQQFGVHAAGTATNDPEVERLVQRVLEQMDANKDGRISREEARGPLQQNFDRLDTNHDGFLDRAELRHALARFLANRKNDPALHATARPPGPDFDALDKNADGRLTREELEGTPYADKFDEIDANGDGKIDRKEFAAYLKKQEEKK